MTSEVRQRFNGNSKGFSLGWDAPDVRPAVTQSFCANKIEPVETMSNTRGQKFLANKKLDVSTKIGTSNFNYTYTESTPKITRNDRQKSTFYFGDIPPQCQKSFQRRQKAQKQHEQETERYDTLKTLRLKTNKDQIQKLHNQNISKIQQSVKKRPPFRF